MSLISIHPDFVTSEFVIIYLSAVLTIIKFHCWMQDRGMQLSLSDVVM